MSEGTRKRVRVADVLGRPPPVAFQAMSAPNHSGQGAAPFDTWANLTFPDASLQPQTSSVHSTTLHPANPYALSPSTDGSSSALLPINRTASYAPAAPWPQTQYSQPNNGAAAGTAQMNGAANWPEPGAPMTSDNVQQPPAEQTSGARFNILSDVELGDLVDLWNWESLDLGFMMNPIL